MKLSLTLLAGLTLVGVANRGEVYGTVRMGKELLAGVPLTITTATGSVSDTTDKYGAYRVFAKENGKATITVHYRNQAPTLSITSVGDGVRYRLVLQDVDGKYQLHSE